MKLVGPDKKRILFADDDIAFGGITKLSLEHSGYEVNAVNSGFAALRTFSISPCSFDLVILDQEMPDFKGTEVAEKLASLRPGLPIVLYTSSQDDDLAATAQAVGIREVASKSLTTEELLDVISRTVHAAQEKPVTYRVNSNNVGPGLLPNRERSRPLATRANHHAWHHRLRSVAHVDEWGLPLSTRASKHIGPDSIE